MGELPTVFGHHVASTFPDRDLGLNTWVLAIGIKESSRVNNAMWC
jgi:hypothetical protein